MPSPRSGRRRSQPSWKQGARRAADLGRSLAVRFQPAHRATARSVADDRGRPGHHSIQALCAAHALPLNDIGEPFLVTTGRRLREGGWPPGVDTVVVMLDGGTAFQSLDPEGLHIWWGAYLGMPIRSSCQVSSPRSALASSPRAQRRANGMAGSWTATSSSADPSAAGPPMNDSVVKGWTTCYPSGSTRSAPASRRPSRCGVARQAQLTKPAGALGRLEQLAVARRPAQTERPAPSAHRSSSLLAITASSPGACRPIRRR